MNKARRILALIGVILLLAMYASTMVFALMDSPYAKALLMGSIYCTIAVPVLLYVMMLVAKHLGETGEKIRRREAEAAKTAAAQSANEKVKQSSSETAEEETADLFESASEDNSEARSEEVKSSAEEENIS